MTFQERFIAQNGQHIHKLKAKDTTGRWAYYFVYVKPEKEKIFLDALADQERTIDLEDYGIVVASCYGEQPNEAVKQFLKEKYGFDV